ncbi:hypothetical protein SAY86_002449 [Trapa natans]|uniref:Scarecrow-like protein 14 n=1 Tax=Trapa natans TaxID=22666 RepID=A0AAN7LHV0_TRANT|nr:hypothetical protein SAY86_002449 [Trapa natans]
MDSNSNGLSFSVDNFDFESHLSVYDSNQILNSANEFSHGEPALSSLAVPPLLFGASALDNLPMYSIDRLDEGMLLQAELNVGSSTVPSSLGSGGESSSSDDCDLSDPVMKYLSQMLMDESIDEKFWIFPNEIAVRDMEKSLYDVLGEKPPCLPTMSSDMEEASGVSQFVEYLSRDFSDSSNEKSRGGTTVTCTNSTFSMVSTRFHDLREHTQTTTTTVHSFGKDLRASLDNCFPFYAPRSLSSMNANGLMMDTSLSVENAFTGNDSVLQFERGLEEASKFLLPKNQLLVSFENVGPNSGLKEGPLAVYVHNSKGTDEDTVGESRGRKKNRERGNLGLEGGKAAKQLAPYMEAEEFEPSDMLDKVLLWTDKEEGYQAMAPVNKYTDGRRQEDNSSVDLRALLIQCAQALSSNNLQIACELLLQIRLKSSPKGDGCQRLAHQFANALEARMVGNHSATRCFHASMAEERRSMVDILKAFQLHLLACPFKKFSIEYMNHMIWKMLQKASVLHIIDFGVGFGFQWPILIQKLGERDGGPPKLRITGIELPQPGFRPAQGIEEAGRRLAQYCERFNVPFEYMGLPSRNWEDIKMDDLKLRSGEMIAVNCLMRFRNFLDDVTNGHIPKDALLNLIRRIKPDIFVNMVLNAPCNAPYFMRRFKESLFHHSAIYDMFDTTIPSEYKDSEEREVLENDFYGREIMNIVACEGPDRVERPESYKQWQVRHTRAGFKQLPLDEAMIKRFRHKLKAMYHKEFTLDVDGHWILLGWKGRIIYATACWVPT